MTFAEFEMMTGASPVKPKGKVNRKGRLGVITLSLLRSPLTIHFNYFCFGLWESNNNNKTSTQCGGTSPSSQSSKAEDRGSQV